MSAGIAMAKAEKYPGMPTFKRSERGLKIWIANMANGKKKLIAEKVAAKTHTSTRRVMQEFPLYLRCAKNREFLNNFAEEFELDKELITWMKTKAL